MTDISLQELINAVRTELFSSYKGTKLEGKSSYPIFLVDQVELEIDFNINNSSESGIKISIPQILEASAKNNYEQGTTNKMKILLKPIVDIEELKKILLEDPILKENITKASIMALRKGHQVEEK